jgi:hypothetical protein
MHPKDIMTEGQSVEEAHTIYNIALVKSYAYCEEYNPTTGQVNKKQGERYLKEGYIEGFLAGFAYKFTGEK